MCGWGQARTWRQDLPTHRSGEWVSIFNPFYLSLSDMKHRNKRIARKNIIIVLSSHDLS